MKSTIAFISSSFESINVFVFLRGSSHSLASSYVHIIHAGNSSDLSIGCRMWSGKRGSGLEHGQRTLCPYRQLGMGCMSNVVSVDLRLGRRWQALLTVGIGAQKAEGKGPERNLQQEGEKEGGASAVRSRCRDGMCDGSVDEALPGSRHSAADTMGKKTPNRVQ
jgi:hypothetical protein